MHRSDLTKPNIAIIGTGALACLFGARLSQVANITLIGTWQAQIDAINVNGVTVKELSGDEQVFQVNAKVHPFKDGFNQADFALLLVKSFQTAAAAKRVRDCIKPNGVTLSLQNGLGNQEVLLAELPFHMISSGSTMQGAHLDPNRPGVVTHAGNGASIIDNKPFLAELKALLETAGLPVQTHTETDAFSIEAVLWRKMIVNASINPLTALLGEPNGFIAADPLARKLCIATTKEAVKIAQLEGNWPENKDAELIGIEVAQSTANNRSSMLQDVSRGGRTEIEAICGEIVRRAERLNVQTPINRLWLDLVTKVNEEGATDGRQVYSAAALLQKLGAKL
ncbi:MAG: ketopantoate reductase family protein [Anaerolineae bacterium]